MKEYNGYNSWNQWNVSLWINNDESIYRMAVELLKEYPFEKAVNKFHSCYKGCRTPDGATYNRLSIKRALEGMEE